MFIHYYDLIDENKLPTEAYYTEPRDLHIIPITPKDNYITFSKKVADYRISKDYPKLNPNEIRFLILSSLEATTLKQNLPQYFTLKSVLPQFSQLVTLARTLAANVGQRSIGYNQRQKRATKCIGCTLHRPNNNIAHQAYIQQAVHLSNDHSHETLLDLQLSPEEAKLGQCGMCGCGLKAKVTVSALGVLAGLSTVHLDTLIKIYGPEAFSKCWIMDECLNDHNLKTILIEKLNRSAFGGKQALDVFMTNKINESKK